MNKDLTTLFTGRNLISLESTESTNTYLSSLLRANTLPEGTVITTREQTQGRGQAGTSWKSEAGSNVLASLVFYPSFITPRDVFILNKCYALGVYDCVRTFLGENVSIK